MLALMALAAGCETRPSRSYMLGEVQAEIDFSRVSDWERYVNPDQRVNFQVDDATYRVRADHGGFMWTLNTLEHDDVVIQADSAQLSDDPDNAYGLMCRASGSANGDGYYFFISGDGMYTIRRGAGRQVGALIPWTRSPAIQQGRGLNRIRIVCVDDYLALYVNGAFVAETFDSLYRRGYAGLTAAAAPEGDLDVTFDDLIIWRGELVAVESS
jgi:hypothetical protein